MATILFIEDESILQKSFRKMFENEGYKTVSALDGEIGVNLAKKIRPDLILLDLILPKKNGFEVLEELKKTPETKDIPVIILTNLERNEDIDKALEIVATTYLVKANYSLKEVIGKVRQTLAKA